MRHNAVRNTEAALMDEVAKDVQLEPSLLPTGNTELPAGSNVQNQARLDISARGIWSSNERTMFDVRITHPYCNSNIKKPLDSLLDENEKEKMRQYNARVLEVEKSTFVPLVYTTNGGMGKQCQKLHQQLAQLICAKRGDNYSIVMSHIRTRIRFALLKSTLVAIRGYRGRSKKEEDTIPLNEIDFGMAGEEVKL